MSRTPTDKSLRAGQTIYYASYVPCARSTEYKLRSVAVMSDSSELPPAHIIADGFPRWFIRERLAVGGGPEFVSYSRRKVISWIKAQTR